MPHPTAPHQVHTTTRLTTPTEEPADIDDAMVPLIQALWAWDATTIQCCQDAGASILNGGWLYPPHRRTRYAAFWDGYAWLKMPATDATRLRILTADLAPGNGWECTIPILPGGRTGVANLYFPAHQLNEVEKLVRSDS